MNAYMRIQSQQQSSNDVKEMSLNFLSDGCKFMIKDQLIKEINVQFVKIVN